MDLKDLITVIPELLLLVVPGFISLRIKEKYSLERKHDRFDSIIYSLFYSFIIGIMYSVVRAILSSLILRIDSFMGLDKVKQAGYLLLSVPFGFCIVSAPKTRVGKWIDQHFNKHLSPEPSVWFKAMQNPNGAWATVYMKNGMIYTGQLMYYSTDPEEEERAILLCKYRLSIQNENMVQSSGDFSTIIVDNLDKEDSKVYLDFSNIISIEIVP